MSEVISKEPTPPPVEFLWLVELRNSTLQDVLGRSALMLKDYILALSFDVVTGQAFQQYWMEVQEFYGIPSKDIFTKKLGQVASEYGFSDPNREYIEDLSIEDSLISTQFESAGELEEYQEEEGLEYPEKQLSDEIKLLRDELRITLAYPENIEYLREYMEEVAPSIFNDWRIAEDGNEYSWHEWLVDIASQEQFINFLQWNNHHMIETNNDPEYRAEILREKTEYKRVVRQFIDEGELPAGAVVEEDIDSLEVYIGDIFTTVMERRTGYYLDPNTNNPSSRYVIVGEGFIVRSTRHELNHAVMGRYRDRWLNEATTEHLTICMDKRRVGDVCQFIDEGVYEQERRLLDIVMGGRGGFCPIPISTLFGGYVESGNEGDQDQFEKAVDEAWGAVGTLQKIQSAIEDLEKKQVLNGRSLESSRFMALGLVRLALLYKPEFILDEKLVSNLYLLFNHLL